LNEKTESDTER